MPSGFRITMKSVYRHYMGLGTEGMKMIPQGKV